MGSCEPSLRVKETGRFPPDFSATDSIRLTTPCAVFILGSISLQRLVEKTIGGNYGEDAGGAGWGRAGILGTDRPDLALIDQQIRHAVGKIVCQRRSSILLAYLPNSDDEE